MENKRQKLFFLASEIAGKTKKIIPRSVQWKIKNRILKKEIDNYLKKRQKDFIYKGCLGGINLIGNIRAEMGLGQSCRLIANMILKCNCGLSIYNTDTNGNIKKGDASFDEYISDKLPYQVNIFHVNPLELGKVFIRIPKAWEKKYNVAFWLWELEVFPKEWIIYCNLFDEIWTPSQFAADSIRKATNVPVKVIPYFVVASCEESITRKDFKLPGGKFLFLAMFDVNSTLGRKNPLGAVKAFKQAFSAKNQNVGLVIKVNNADEAKLAKLKKELEDYNNVYMITEVMEKKRTNRLIECVDVFVSLHRAEGFGLVMAEAMMLGTPVIATNWSANVEFMDTGSACMVDYRLIKNPKDEDLYKKGCVWAEPDCKQAAIYMKRLATDTEYYALMQENGKRSIKEKLGEANTIDVLRQEIDRVWKYMNIK
ncbi:MAG: glycosyltransferase family 4 protein [Lachnospiraceae bacterium]|nr:glycosyltransferase family 4 protein [Lachnospiraceae bacterium]